MKPITSIIIPVYNEEASIGKVIHDIPVEIVEEIIVVNNNSTDATKEVAINAGATVLDETQKGYGSACLKGIDYLKSKPTPPDIVVFLDGDYSDYPEEMALLLAPIHNDSANIVIGSRTLGKRERGSMTPQQIFGNWLASMIIHLFYRIKVTDLGPFRAILWENLIEIDMKDTTYGWTVEMQVKAAKHKLKMVEVAVNYRKRIGKSKISGTIKGTILAGVKIIWTIFKHL